ncbi:MAG TPA: ATP-dependent DNA helicase RecG [Solirubrobacteraceae bacterium]|nr:ATP-dependent DNA helicase RecG [Solirubrobacteraceae bacterium]
MLPRAFASANPLDHSELEAAPLRSVPRPSRLAKPLEITPSKAAKAAEALGLHTVSDLLEHLPRDQRDRRSASTIAALVPGEDASLIVEVRDIRLRPTRKRRLTLVEATVADETGPIKAVWFNQPWVVKRLPPGSRAVLHGRCERRSQFRVSEYEPAGGASAEDLHSTGLVPIYPATDGLPSGRIRELAWNLRGAEHDVVEPLAATLRATQGLPDRPAALAAIHFPQEPGDAEAGRVRLAFDELLLQQLAVLRRRAQRDDAGRAAPLDQPRGLTERWLTDALPFSLTADQRAAIDQIEANLSAGRPMQRLLMGEVGSGKTVCALFALLRAVEHDMQAALMAPTETLAEQHFATIASLMPGELVPMALLTGSTPAARRDDVLSKLASGEVGLVVGTHALIEPGVQFANLAVAVVDEQHRFGVRQRAALDAKAPPGLQPHVLHMTATPIPRTLALTAYGDLDSTVLRELPQGRQPIETHVVAGARERARAYERIREELRAGRQAFVICPLVEESDQLQVRAATAEFERLARGEFADFEVVLMHGQLPTREKQAAMAAFAGGVAHVLVATSVVEVGIDVANASVMLVEDADRYGISQLHQLRGRVGRGEHRSLCLLFGPKGSARLRAMAQYSDGFKLAEIDLELRGEGEMIGTRQSGLAQFRVARLPEDAGLLDRAKAVADQTVARDPTLEDAQNALLADALQQAYGQAALAPIPA